jgi:L-glyceraldehyde 3-phosphate reductase
MLDRWVEPELLPALADEGIGCIAFSPLAQGVLTDRYLGGAIPADSRAAGSTGFLRPAHITPERVQLAEALNRIAQARGQTLAQLALAWVLRQPAITSVLIGASRPAQIVDAVGALACTSFDAAELARIDELLA